MGSSLVDCYVHVEGGRGRDICAEAGGLDPLELVEGAEEGALEAAFVTRYLFEDIGLQEEAAVFCPLEEDFPLAAARGQLVLGLAGLVLLVGGAGETLVEQGFGVHLCGGGVGFEGSAEEGGRPAVEGEEWRVLVGNARNGDEGGIFGELFGDQDQGGRGSEAVELFIVGEIGEGLEQFGEAGGLLGVGAGFLGIGGLSAAPPAAFLEIEVGLGGGDGGGAYPGFVAGHANQAPQEAG